MAAFASPGAPATLAGYEARIHAHGEMDTRPGNWHDLFNALVWCAFPRAKAALNVRHHGALREAAEARRGARRDAATQFDECGAVLAGCRPNLLAALRAHRWREVLWVRRGELLAATCLIVFGHATYDALRRPFHGLRAKWLAMPVAADFIAAPVAEQVAAVDRRLAVRLADPGFLDHPRAAAPLPLLGWPGLVAAADDPAWYEDTRQFRPAPLK